MTELSQTVMQEIRAEMARQRVSQHALAERLGWTQAYLSRRLTGDVPISVDDVHAIAGALEISAARMLYPVRFDHELQQAGKDQP